MEREAGVRAAETMLMDVARWRNSTAAVGEADRIWAETLSKVDSIESQMYEMMMLIFLSIAMPTWPSRRVRTFERAIKAGCSTESKPS